MSNTGYSVAGRDTLVSMSGLDFMQAMVRGDLPHPPMAQTANLRCQSAEHGHVVFHGSPTDAHLNPMGTTHGGWFGTILDTALGCTVMTVTPKGSVYTTLEYKVNLTRGIPPGTEMVAEGRIEHAGRSTAVATATLKGLADGKTYATASTTCIIMTVAP